MAMPNKLLITQLRVAEYNEAADRLAWYDERDVPRPLTSHPDHVVCDCPDCMPEPESDAATETLLSKED